MTEDDRMLTVRIPLVFRKHGGRKTLVSPDGSAWGPSGPLVDRTLVRALALAFRWKRLLEDGVYGTLDELASAEGVSQSYVSRVLRLTLLGPDLIEAILDGRQGKDVRLEGLLTSLPGSWAKAAHFPDDRRTRSGTTPLR